MLNSKPRFWENGSLLLGITYFVLGLVVLAMSFSRLRDFILFVIPHLPFSLPGDPLGFILKSLPTILAVFVCFISAVAGFLFGLKWVFGGLAQILRKRGQVSGPSELANQENILSFLDFAEAPSSSGAPFKEVNFKNNFFNKWFNPGAHDFVSYVLVSNFKIVAALATLWILKYFLVSGPIMLKQHTGIQLNFVVPTFRDLGVILGCLFVTNGVLAISFISLSKKTFRFDNRSFFVSGRTALVFFMSIFEEICSLFNPRNSLFSPAKRFIRDDVDGAHKIATLFESHPLRKYGHVNLLVYILFPLSFGLSIWGFASLIKFRLDFPDMEYEVFFYRYFFEMIMQIAFPCFLIMSGFHLMNLVRRIFEISRFESHLIACYCETVPSSEATAAKETAALSNKWRHYSGPENDLIKWIKNPESLREFAVKICWARIATEAPLIREARWVTLMQIDKEFQGLIERSLDGLKKVQFEMQRVSDQDS